MKKITAVLIMTLMLIMVISVTACDNEQEHVVDEPITLETTPEPATAPTPEPIREEEEDERQAVPLGFWMQVLTTTEFSAGFTADEMESALYSEMPFAQVRVQDGDTVVFSNVLFADFDEDETISLRLRINYDNDRISASFTLIPENDDFDSHELYDFLFEELNNKFILIDEFDNNVLGPRWAAYGNGLLRVHVTHRDRAGEIEVVFNTVPSFVYVEPDLLYSNVRFDPDVLTRIVPTLTSVADGNDVSRFAYSLYGAIAQDSDGQVSATMVMNHEFPDKVDFDEDTRNDDGSWIMDTFASARNALGSAEFRSVGFTPYTMDMLSPLTNRGSVDNLIPITVFNFSTLWNQNRNLVDENYNAISVDFTQEARELNTLVDVEWIVMSYDRDSIVDVYRQLVVAFMDFYYQDDLPFAITVSNTIGGRGDSDPTRVYLLPYWSEAINGDTIDFTLSAGDSHSVQFAVRNNTNDTHPALDIGGVELTLRFSEESGRYAIRVNFLYQVDNFVIPSTSQILN